MKQPRGCSQRQQRRFVHATEAVALEDTAVVLIAPDVVRHLFEASPRLARETGYTLDVQRKALQSARTALAQR
jgi:hypothetical protein